MSDVTIGIDLGGTRIKAVAINNTGQVLYEHYQPTNDGDDKIWKNAVKNAVQILKKEIGVGDVIIGISAPGLPNSANSAIGYMPGRLQGLENFIWTDFL